jgi:spermidine/putrescine transport system permease protein
MYHFKEKRNPAKAEAVGKLPRGAVMPGGYRRRRQQGEDSTELERRLLSIPAVAVILGGFCFPLGVLLVYSFWQTTNSGEVQPWHWTIVNYKRFFTDAIYWQTLVRSFVFVTVASGIAVVSTLPVAYFVALRVTPQRRMVCILVAILPFSMSYLIRVVAWMTLLGDGGIINSGLRRAHLISSPLGVFGYNRYGIVLTFVYLLFPLSFLMTYVAIERMDPALLDSASDLGAPLADAQSDRDTDC